jgi:hypothetical protein
MSKKGHFAPGTPLTQMRGTRLSRSSKRISNCDLPLERASTEQTKAAISADAGNLRRRYKVCRAAVDVLADLAVVDALKRPASSTLVRVGKAIYKGVRITAHLLGPTRIDGGIVLLTQSKGGECSHRVYLLDDLCQENGSSCHHTGCKSELGELIEKAVAKRSQLLSGTTNYFSGITGKVIKIL